MYVPFNCLKMLVLAAKIANFVKNAFDCKLSSLLKKIFSMYKEPGLQYKKIFISRTAMNSCAVVPSMMSAVKWIQIALYSCFSPLSSTTSGLLMIDDITSDKTEGRPSAYLLKSYRPTQALRSMSPQEKVVSTKAISRPRFRCGFIHHDNGGRGGIRASKIKLSSSVHEALPLMWGHYQRTWRWRKWEREKQVAEVC